VNTNRPKTTANEALIHLKHHHDIPHVDEWLTSYSQHKLVPVKEIEREPVGRYTVNIELCLKTVYQHMAFECVKSRPCVEINQDGSLLVVRGRRIHTF